MWPFGKRERSSVALIDIGSQSIGGALAHYDAGKLPALCYSTRIPLAKGGNGSLDGVTRTLAAVGEKLVREGAPLLRDVAGSGSIDHILVNLGSPWQETSIERAAISPKKAFTYTKGIETEALARLSPPDTSRAVERNVVATLLNGYLTRLPYGKRANRAELVVLTSSLDHTATAGIEDTLRPLFHTRSISYTSFAESSFKVLCALYPHQHEFLTLSVTGEATEVASVKRGFLIDIGTLRLGTDSLVSAAQAASREARTVSLTAAPPAEGYIQPERNARFGEEAGKAEAAWRESLVALLREFAIRHALPRTVFLVAEPEVRGFLRQTLDDPSMHALWLSDEPITVIPLLPKHFSGSLKTLTHEGDDSMLALLALNYSPKG